MQGAIDEVRPGRARSRVSEDPGGEGEGDREYAKNSRDNHSALSSGWNRSRKRLKHPHGHEGHCARKRKCGSSKQNRSVHVLTSEGHRDTDDPSNGGENKERKKPVDLSASVVKEDGYPETDENRAKDDDPESL